MKKNRKYWKETAKSVLRGNWGIAIAGMLAYMAVDFLGTIVSAELFPGEAVLEVILGQVFVFVVSLIAMVFSTGYSYMMLNMSRGREFSLGNLLYMFHNQPGPCADRSLCMALLSTVLTSVLFCYVSGNSRKYNRRTAFVDGTDFWSYAFEYSTECTYHGTICT